MRTVPFVLVVLLCAARLPAQSGAGSLSTLHGHERRWVEAWSPLAPLADFARDVPRTPGLPSQLSLPAPRVGLLWTAGNPAGLPSDVRDRHGEVRALLGHEAGTYRRPFDEDKLGVRSVVATRWQPLGEHASIAGRVIAEDATSDIGPLSSAAARYTTDPFVVTDTSTSALRRLRARLEGAYGLRYRDWSFGFAIGLEMMDLRTRVSRLPRLTRASTPGIQIGVARMLPWNSAVSAYGRWLGASETVRLIAYPHEGVAFLLHGYNEPSPRLLGSAEPQLFRYTEREASAGGLAIAGAALGATWTIYSERNSREDVHFNTREETESPDRWEADGWRFGGAVTRAVLGDRVQVTILGEYAVLDGHAFRADLEGRILDIRESVFQNRVDVRYRAGQWTFAGVYEMKRERRTRDDFLAAIASEITTWMPAGALEIARELSPHTSASVAVASSFYSPLARIPNPNSMGPVYQQMIAPEISYYSSRARPLAGAITVRHRISDAIHLLVRTGGERLQPVDADEPVPFAPDGDRTAWSFAASVLWDR